MHCNEEKIYFNIIIKMLGTNPGPTTLAYCMAKSALEQFNRCLAVGN